MKKYIGVITFSLALFLFLAFFFVGCKGDEVTQNSQYNISIEFDGENTLRGSERVTFENSSDNALDYVQFNLYANAFKDKDKVVTTGDERAYYEGFNEGGIQILRVAVEGQDGEFSLSEDDEIMIVSLGREIYPDESALIEIDFILTLANVNHRLGRGENTINLGNFYPILSVYENGVGFYTTLYKPFGDPFYSGVADYQVSISCPEEFIVASSGQGTREGNVSTFEGKNIRDFALVLSKDFSSKKKKGVCEVEYFGYEGDENINECLDLSLKAVEYFSNNFGEYPYEKLTVVKNSFLQGGMEYSGLVMISDEVEDVEYVIVHEIAHQWWYGGVGNNQFEHAWIDEGLAEYSSLMFFRDNGGYGVDYKEYLNACTSSYKLYEKVQNKVYGRVDGVMDKNLDNFLSSPDYVAMAYTKSTLMFNSLEEGLGRGKFLSALRKLYEDYLFKVVSPPEVIACFSSSSHRDLEGFFTSWLHGKTVVL